MSCGQELDHLNNLETKLSHYQATFDSLVRADPVLSQLNDEINNLDKKCQDMADWIQQ